MVEELKTAQPKCNKPEHLDQATVKQGKVLVRSTLIALVIDMKPVKRTVLGYA